MMETTVFTPGFSNSLLAASILATIDETLSLPRPGERLTPFDTLEAAKTPLEDDEEDEDEDDDELEDDDEDDDLEDDDLEDEEDDDDDDLEDDEDEDDEDEDDAVEDDDPKPLRVKSRM